jgi:hypothetical protein
LPLASFYQFLAKIPQAKFKDKNERQST